MPFRNPDMSNPASLDSHSNHAVFSFFSGAGFLDLGFEKAGFEIAFANELNAEFVEGYRHSRAKMGLPLPRFGIACDSIDDHLVPKGASKLKKQVAETRQSGQSVGFIGGPPCPDFSVGGKNRGHTGDNGKLSRSYIDLILAQKPDWFVFENVKGLWRTKRHREFFDQLVADLEAAGYQVKSKLLNSIAFGAPQDRDRIILFGASTSFMKKHKLSIANFDWNTAIKHPERSAFDFKWPTTSKFGASPTPTSAPNELTVQHWFTKNDVTTHPNAVHCFTPRAALPRFQTISEGDDSKKCFKRLHRHRYSPTACYGNNEVHLHPFEARRISVAEALAVQSLPREFELPASMSLSAMFKTIGNGVPFLMAQGIALSVKKLIAK
jgi:DNA (cytosine-5)-methyltransferase 1